VRPGFRRAAPLLAVFTVTLAACGSSSPPPPPWTLVWSDEFDEAALDTTQKWTIDTGNNFGTGQQDYDTDRPENVTVTGGQLVLTARQEAFSGAAYTSGRIESAGKFSQTYGRFEASIQIPKGQGMWPAFWMLGANFTTVGWPQCGEIDIMECRGVDPTTVYGSLHGPGGTNLVTGYQLPSKAPLSDGFHQYAVEWEPGVVRYYVDGALYETRPQDLFTHSQPWVFDAPFFLILDLAVGGQFGGPAGTSTAFPQSMTVEYVHVYAREYAPAAGGS
jgi:beta-glucanase (GH16 family)